MSREIKFRVWDEISETMTYPGEGKYCITQLGRVCWDESDDGGRLENRSYRCKAMLSTGLLDSNGKEIFEGDIVSRAGAYIVWDDRLGCWAFQFSDREEFDHPTPLHRDLMSAVILGNIYQNPDLLEGHETE